MGSKGIRLRASDIVGLRFNNLDWEKNIIHFSQYKTDRTIELPLLVINTSGC
jgi:integrase